ncbi:MAG: membrane-anchored protein YejM (alkaline phosphatase superfamily) [bacterium]|jgi:membrane-anchored protein YejM (alkaline phosphatase superfamily)
MKLMFKKCLTKSDTIQYFIFFLLFAFCFFLFSLSFIRSEILHGNWWENAYLLITSALNPFYIAILVVFPLLCLLHLPFRLIPNERVSKVLFHFVFSLLVSGLITIMIIDKVVYHLYQFHLNGFVLKVLQQPDAWKTLGLSTKDVVAVVASLFVGFFVSWGVVVWLERSRVTFWIQKKLSGFLRKVVFVSILIFVLLADKSGFSWLVFQQKSSVSLLSQAVPAYIPAKMNGFFEDKLGLKPPKKTLPEINLAQKRVNYPLKPYVKPVVRKTKPKHIIWLVADAFRSDVINATVMPNTYALSTRSKNYVNHFSGSNGTSNGLFSLFYSIPASYLHPFSKAQVNPLFIDVLLKNQYQFHMFSSADMGWFGTDQVIFFKVRDRIKGDLDPDGVKSDQKVTNAAIQVLKKHDRKKPLFLMVFYDSMHLPHFNRDKHRKFKPSNVGGVFDPSNKKHRIRGINDYKNAAHYVDKQLGQLLKGIKKEGYLKDSVIMVTGDHGSEKYEHGHWGHASAFTNEQLMVPMILSYPNVKPSIEKRFTSHVDVVPTMMELMGETFPFEYYSTGQSLLNSKKRDFIVASGDINRVLIDTKYKIDYNPVSIVPYYRVTDSDDNLIQNSEKILQVYTPKILKMFNQYRKFMK